MGYDWAIEQKRIEAEKAARQADMMSGNVPTPPGVVPPGMMDNGDGTDSADAEQGDTGNMPPALAMARQQQRNGSGANGSNPNA